MSHTDSPKNEKAQGSFVTTNFQNPSVCLVGGQRGIDYNLGVD